MTSFSFHTSSGDLEIRPAGMEDLPGFRELRLRALHDYPEAFSADYQTHREGGDNIWIRDLEKSENSILYLAVHQSVLVGMTGVYKSESPKTRHNADIWGVYVLPEWRGLGIADVLINTCCKWAGNAGATIARLGVTTTNHSAIRCYQRCGFIITGTDPQAIFTGGVYYDEYLMTRKLG